MHSKGRLVKDQLFSSVISTTYNLCFSGTRTTATMYTYKNICLWNTRARKRCCVCVAASRGGADVCARPQLDHGDGDADARAGGAGRRHARARRAVVPQPAGDLRVRARYVSTLGPVHKATPQNGARSYCDAHLAGACSVYTSVATMGFSCLCLLHFSRRVSCGQGLTLELVFKSFGVSWPIVLPPLQLI